MPAAVSERASSSSSCSSRALRMRLALTNRTALSAYPRTTLRICASPCTYARTSGSSSAWHMAATDATSGRGTPPADVAAQALTVTRVRHHGALPPAKRRPGEVLANNDVLKQHIRTRGRHRRRSGGGGRCRHGSMVHTHAQHPRAHYWPSAGLGLRKSGAGSTGHCLGICGVGVQDVHGHAGWVRDAT